jgi:two-component system, cell cycle response regulator
MDSTFGETTQVRRLDLGIAPHVLLVDDDDLVLGHLEELVSAAGFKVRTAPSGADALASLEETFTPVVIADLNMPGMGGLELCRKIRQHPWSGYIYLLLLTVQDAEQDILAGLEAGADDYLSKRSSSAHLLARLRTAQRLLALEQSLKDALTQTRRLAVTDPLTGAPNRLYFQQRLGRELRRLRRFGGDLCLMSLDIDNFKQINDRYGHSSGDAVLQEFVRRIGRTLPRDTDWYARIGGEEFAVILDGTNLPGGALVAEKVRLAIADTPITTSNALLNVTVSIGVSGLSTGADRSDYTIESLLQLADRGLYASKERGRNCVSLPRFMPAIQPPELSSLGRSR